jgi:hypothetical protein
MAIPRPSSSFEGGHRARSSTYLPRHRHQEFLRFLRQVAKAYARRELHLV